MDRIFLAFVGLAYLALGIWCTAAPESTSQSIGFTRRPGQGESEFLTVYGGLEVALGILFLWPICRREDVGYPLLTCLIVHGCLVAFRTAGFFVYRRFEDTTYVLASVEWTIFIAAVALVYRRKQSWHRIE